MSGQKDSNLRPPAPKAGALAGLRHTPKKKTIFIVFFLRGEGGIRTPGTHCWIRQFSKLLVSATHPPLLGCELRCKSRLFSDTYKRFLSLFLILFCYSLNYSEINCDCFLPIGTLQKSKPKEELVKIEKSRKKGLTFHFFPIFARLYCIIGSGHSLDHKTN